MVVQRVRTRRAAATSRGTRMAHAYTATRISGNRSAAFRALPTLCAFTAFLRVRVRVSSLADWLGFPGHYHYHTHAPPHFLRGRCLIVADTPQQLEGRGGKTYASDAGPGTCAAPACCLPRQTATTPPVTCLSSCLELPNTPRTELQTRSSVLPSPPLLARRGWCHTLQHLTPYPVQRVLPYLFHLCSGRDRNIMGYCGSTLDLPAARPRFTCPHHPSTWSPSRLLLTALSSGTDDFACQPVRLRVQNTRRRFKLPAAAFAAPSALPRLSLPSPQTPDGTPLRAGARR